MKRFVIAKIIVGIGLLAGLTIGAFLHFYDILYVCTVEFSYQDVSSRHAPFELDNGDYRKVDGQFIESRYRSLLLDFDNRENFPLPLEKIIQRSRLAPEIASYGEQRARNIFSSAKLSIVDIPPTNFMFRCRLVLTDLEKSNIEDYAKFYMMIISECFDSETKRICDKSVFREVQNLRKAERRIEELQYKSSTSSLSYEENQDLRQLMALVQRLKSQIELKQKEVADRSARRIAHQSEPMVTWMLLRR